VDLYELWRARVRGRFTLKHYLYAWLISARPFAIPWVTLFTLFGALLAGVESAERALASCLVVALITLASHFNNNYKDVELGFDKYIETPEEAELMCSTICSTIKPYTAASWIVPLRITSVRFQKANEYLCIALAVTTYLWFFSGDVAVMVATLPVVALGLALARTYVSVFKKARLGEVAVFLGHGFGTVALGYLSQRPDILVALLSGVPTGLISALVYSVDQFVDIRTDFVEKVRAIYESWFNSRMPLGLYALLAIAFWYNVVVAWVVAGIYPRGVLLVLATLPLILFTAPQLEYQRSGALLKLAITATFLVPMLMCIGALLH